MNAGAVVDAAPLEAMGGRTLRGSRVRPSLPAGSLALAAAAAAVVGIGVTALQRSGGVGAGLSAGRAELLAPPVLLVVAVGNRR